MKAPSRAALLLTLLLVASVALPTPALAMKKGTVKFFANPGTSGLGVECGMPVPDGADLSLPEGMGCSTEVTGQPAAQLPVGGTLLLDLPGIVGLSVDTSLGGRAVVLVCSVEVQGVAQQCAQEVPIPL
ncbi:MAG: hypothetical protein LC624_08300 [Halobacteriales archaeon]|nr:hypothetical protein [Halobacteriales archaeon]